MAPIPEWLLSILQHFSGYFTVSSTVKRTVTSAAYLHSEEMTSESQNPLPLDITSWKASMGNETIRSVEIWESLRPLFKQHGLSLWASNKDDMFAMQRIDTMPSPNGYFYHNRHSLAGSANWQEWWPDHGAHHAARSDSRGSDYIIAVMAVGNNDEKGRNHLRIVRQLSRTYPDILLSNNHILPMVKEIFYKEVVFAVYPMLQGVTLSHCLLPNMPYRSVEDAVYLLLQALEGIKYIHSKRIAHRDLFLENFLVEWVPMSLERPETIRPRVYLIDFETAVQFGEDVAPEAMVLDSNNLPFPQEVYDREPAPELYIDADYCPFKLDIWQFGHGLIERFTSTTISEIDTLWPTLVVENPSDRPTADEILLKLRSIVNSTPPQQLQIPFDFEMIR